MRGKVLFCRATPASGQAAAEKQDGPQNLIVHQASGATRCSMVKTSTLRPAGESESGLRWLGLMSASGLDHVKTQR